MINRYFQNAQARSRRFHLHLQIPAIGLFTHREFLQSITPNCPKWGHVGVMDAIQCADQKSGQISGEYLLRVHAPCLAVSAGARTDHKVMCAVYDWLHQRRHKFWDIASVTVHEYNQIAFARDCGYTCGAGAAISADRRNHSGTSLSGTFRGSIGATIINNNHFARNFRRQHFADDLRDRFLLI